MHAMQTHSTSIARFSHVRIVQMLSRTSAKLCYTVFSMRQALPSPYISKFATKLMIFGELWGMSVTLSQSVVPQLIGQGCAADTQQTSNLCDIVVGLFKSRHYLLLLYRLVSESQFHRHFGFRLEKRYVLFRYCVAVCVEGGEKDYILQFPHVARPRMHL